MGTVDKAKLLFISYHLPCPTGGGSVMRAFNTLQALSSCYDIELLVFAMGRHKPPVPHPAVKNICSRVVINVLDPVRDYRYLLQRGWARAFRIIFRSYDAKNIDICPGLTPGRKKKLMHSFKGRHFQTVHIFRLASYPVFEAICNVVSYDQLQLDLDDIESDIWTQIHELQQANGNAAKAVLAGRLAAAYLKLEESVLSTLAQIFVCSEQDRAKLTSLYQCKQVTVLPNVYTLPEKSEHIPGVGKFRLLFVGSLGYEPNRDALLYFCDQILPLLGKMAAPQFELRIIGEEQLLPKEARKKIAQVPYVKMLGKVDDVGPYYQQADAAIVPLRAGAGTRLKILEAFAWQVPVVSTSKGVEGLEVTHGQHVLIADTPTDFARQCAQLMADPPLRGNLVQNAKSLVQAKYSQERLTEIFCS